MLSYMPDKKQRKPRSTQIDTIIDMMRELSRRAAAYEGPEAGDLCETLDEIAETWGLSPPKKHPSRKGARRDDLKKGTVVHMLPNELWGFLQNPLTVTEDAAPGRPVRVNVVDADGTPGLVEAACLQIRR